MYILRRHKVEEMKKVLSDENPRNLHIKTLGPKRIRNSALDSR